MMRFLERVLNLRQGDLGRSLLLFFYLFLVISSYVIGKVARDALFLGQFSAVQLPYADIVIALLVGAVIAIYVRIARQVTLQSLLVGSLLFFASNGLFFWVVSQYFHFRWVFPAVYIWVGIFGVLAPAQVWTLANYVLTTREAKRVFGIVGSGAILGWIVAGFVCKQVAKTWGTESLLLIMSGSLIVAAGLAMAICRKQQASDMKAGDDATHLSLRESLAMVWKAPYLRTIAVVIWASSFAITISGWQFKAIATAAFTHKTALAVVVDKNALAAFFGNFNFYAGIAAMLVQLLFTSRFLKRFGLGPALFIVPVSVMFGTAGVLIWGTLLSAVALKSCDQVLRYSIDKSSVELLYLPLPGEVKMQAKSFIDTVIWRMGDGFAGITVLIFATYMHWSAQRVSAVNLVIVGIWIVACTVARRRYVSTLRDCIQQHRMDLERMSTPVLDRSVTALVTEQLQAADPKEVLYALEVLKAEQQVSSHPALVGLLEHPSPEVRVRVISLLDASREKSVLAKIDALVNDPDLNVRTEALLYLAHHTQIDPLARIQELGDYEAFSIRAGVVTYLSRLGDESSMVGAEVILKEMVRDKGEEHQRMRIEAARLLAALPPRFDEVLTEVLEDADPEVAREAIHSAGKTKRRRHVESLVLRLGDHELAADAVEALASYGDGIVGTMRDYLRDESLGLDVRRQIPAALEKIATPSASSVLAEHLFEPDARLRYGVIAALNKLHRNHPDLDVDQPLIETVLAAEIMGHYRSYQILGSLDGQMDPGGTMGAALQKSMEHERERIFRLLALLHPGYDLHSAYVGLQSQTSTVHDNALEFLENVLHPQMRRLLLPLLDSLVTQSERVTLANKLLGTKIATREDAITALVASDDEWLKSCGAYAIGSLGLQELESSLESCLNHPDPLVRETARVARLKLGRINQQVEAMAKAVAR